MRTKKLFTTTMSLFLFFYSFGFSFDFQLGTYITNKYPITDMAKLSFSNIGVGAMAEYTMPFCNFIGVSTNLEAESVISKKENLTNWWDFSASLGAYGNFDFGEYITLRPSLSYGIILHLLEMEKQTKLFNDQIVQFSLSLRIKSKKLIHKGFSYGITPTYTLATEKTTPVHYFGFRTGFHFKF